MRPLQTGSGLYDTIDQVVSHGIERGLGHLTAEDDHLDGRSVRIRGRDLLNLGTASYLHLERHPALLHGARTMLDRYGTQFSASRAYLQLGLYETLEEQLGRIFDRPVLVTGSTTLGHLSALPVLVADDDVLLLDQQVHSSIQTVVQVLKARGVPIHLVRHNRLDELERRIVGLRGTHRRIWYLADGVYSMFGDGAPARGLHELMERHPQLHCYVDDAHGFAWTGRNGCGWFRSRVPHHPRLILAVSLNKAFAAAGGAIVFASEEDRRRVRNCGPTMIFCGPVQPPMLGAALAATQLALSPEMEDLQAQLARRIDHCRDGLVARGIPQVETNDTPLFFVPTGMPKLVQEVAHRLLEDGCYVNLGIFPAVPASMGGIRFHVHRALALADIDGFLDRLAVHHRAVLHEAGTTPARLARAFRMPHLQDIDLTPSASTLPLHTPPALHTEVVTDPDAVAPHLWDACFAGRGPFSHQALRTLMPAFASSDDPARARFVFVRDASGRLVLATFFSTTRMKEDMFASAEVSERAELRRQTEGEDFLVSRAITLGLPLTLGPHLHLDRSHPRWPDAVRALLRVLREARQTDGASRILLREFSDEQDPELVALLREEGLIRVRLPDMLVVQNADWVDRDGLLASLQGRYRRELRREILPFVDAIRVSTGPPCAADIDRAYGLYRRVAARGRQLNALPLPASVFATLCTAPEFDVLRFHIGEELVCVMLSHVRDSQYSALVVGFDERFVASHALYKVALLRTVERGRALGCSTIHLAYTADVAKRKVGARPVGAVAWAQVDDTFDANVLQNL